MYIDPDEREDRSLRVLFARNPPDAFDNCNKFPTLTPTVECPFPGWCVEIINYLAEYMHMNIVPIILNNKVGSMDFGTLDTVTGEWKGALEWVENGTVDTVCLFYQRTSRRAAHFSFSSPLTNVKPMYVVRGVQDVSQLICTISAVSIALILMITVQIETFWNAYSPYGTSTWLAMLGIFILQTLYCIFVSNVEFKMGLRHSYKPLQILWKMICLQLNQHDKFDYSTKAGNFSVVIFAIIQCRLLMEMYAIVILSSLLQPSSLNPFEDPREMIKMIATKEYHLVTNYKDNWYFEELHDSNVSHYRSLRDAIVNNHVRNVHSVERALDLVQSENFIYPTQQDSLAALMAKQRCNLIFVSKNLPEISTHLIFKNHSTFVPKVNNAIAMSSDFIRRTFKKYFEDGFKIDKTLAQCEDHGGREYSGASRGRWHEGEEGFELRPLGIVSLSGVLTILVLGLGLSFLVFLAEFYHNWQRRMFMLRLRTRRALAEPVQQTAIAQYFAGAKVQDRVNEQLERPTIGEIQAHFGELYI